MVNLAIANIGLNKILSTIKANLGRFIIFITLVVFQAGLTVMNLSDIFTQLVKSIWKQTELSTSLTVTAISVSILTAIALEFLVLVFHLNNKHWQSLTVLIVLGIQNFIKMYMITLASVNVWGLNDLGTLLFIFFLAGVPAFGVYFICIDIANDTQLQKVYDNGLNLENAVLAAEDKDDRLYVTTKELKAKMKDAALRQKFANQN